MGFEIWQIVCVQDFPYLNLHQTALQGDISETFRRISSVTNHDVLIEFIPGKSRCALLKRRAVLISRGCLPPLADSLTHIPGGRLHYSVYSPSVVYAFWLAGV